LAHRPARLPPAGVVLRRLACSQQAGAVLMDDDREERDFYTALGRRLYQARREAGLTQREVTEALGLGHSTLCQYELAKRRAPVYELTRLATLYETAVWWLIGETDDDNEERNAC
jgi:DNA-binding XRE family transcriptional regulator